MALGQIQQRKLRLVVSNGDLLANTGHSAISSTIGGGDPPPPPPPLDEPPRKFAAKRRNEMVKLFASGMNTLAGAVLTAAVVLPLVKDPFAFVIEYRPVWYFLGVGLHIAGQVALRFEMRSED